MTTIQVRRGTAAQAAAENPTLAAGEIGFETDTGKLKVGDGVTAWNALAYATDASRLPTTAVNPGGVLSLGSFNGSNDGTRINNLLSALDGPGAILLPAGTATIDQPIVLGSGQFLIGPHPAATILQAAAGLNAPVVQTQGFSSLTGGGTSGGPYNFGFRGITIDGNLAENSGSSAHGFAYYGYGPRLSDFVIRNCAAVGLWEEWGSLSTSPGNDSMEGLVQFFKIHGCNGVQNESILGGASTTSGSGIVFIGPHDTHHLNGIVYANGTGSGSINVDVPPAGYANGGVFDVFHVWGGTYDYGVRLGSSGLILGPSVQIEGGLIAQLLVVSSIQRIFGKFLTGGVNVSTAKGIIVGDSAFTSINNLTVMAKVENCGGGVIDLTYSGGDHDLHVHGQYYGSVTVPSPAVIGTLDASSQAAIVVIDPDGVATSDSVSQSPKKLLVAGTNVGVALADPLSLGVATTADTHGSPSATTAFAASDSAAFASLIGYGQTTASLRVYVGTSSGNISVGTYGNGGQAGTSRLPGTRKGTTGAIPCPASGVATVTLTSSVAIARGDYAAVSCDNTTATFGASTVISAAVADGVLASQASAHPLPATAAAANGASHSIWVATT